jgi:transcriptional regulator with XRE-family HTH domain
MSALRRKTIHEDAYQVLVDCLRSVRREANITQVELANQLGTDQSYVSKYERSERRLDIIEVRAICQALGADFREFVLTFEKRLKRRGLA